MPQRLRCHGRHASSPANTSSRPTPSARSDRRRSPPHSAGRTIDTRRSSPGAHSGGGPDHSNVRPSDDAAARGTYRCGPTYSSCRRTCAGAGAASDSTTPSRRREYSAATALSAPSGSVSAAGSRAPNAAPSAARKPRRSPSPPTARHAVQNAPSGASAVQSGGAGAVRAACRLHGPGASPFRARTPTSYAAPASSPATVVRLAAPSSGNGRHSRPCRTSAS